MWRQLATPGGLRLLAAALSEGSRHPPHGDGGTAFGRRVNRNPSETLRRAGRGRRHHVNRAIPVLALAIGVSSCSSGGPPSAERSPIPSPPVTTSSTPAVASASPPPSTRAAGVSGVRNLVADVKVRQQLLTAYRAARPALPSTDVTGPDKGSVYYSLDADTGTYWAAATFSPSHDADTSARAAFQDGENIGVFTRAADSEWTASVHERPQYPCAEDFPPKVLRVWGLQYDTDC